MDSREFLEQVDWETNIYDVVLVTEETEEEVATWRVTVKPKDQNDIGSDIPIEIDYYLIDNMGNQFRIIDNEYLSVAGNILVSDDFRCGWCPQPDLTGLIVKTVGNGSAPHVASAKLDRLDKVAKDSVQNREKDILWKYPKEVNVKWHPDGIVFSQNNENPNLITYTGGKIFIHLWPSKLESEYRVNNVTGRNNYHPEKSFTVTGTEVTLGNDNLFYVFAKVPLLESATTAELVFTETYRYEQYYDGYLNILMGIWNVPDQYNKRTFSPLWSGVTFPIAAQTIIDSFTGWDQLAWYTDAKPSFNDANRTFTLTPRVSSYRYFVKGVLYTKSSAENLQITDTNGEHYIIYNGSTLEECTIAEWIAHLQNKTACLVATIWWSSDHSVSVITGAEPHSWDISGQDHYRWHKTIGTRYGGGLGLSIAANNWQLDVQEGEIQDEDILISITDSTDPDILFGQSLTPLNAKKLYRLGLSDWHYDNAIPSNIVYLSAGNKVYYNVNTAGTWTLGETTVNKFSAMWVVGTNDWDNPIVMVMGQDEADTLPLARAANLRENMDFSGLPSAEYRILGRVLVKCLSTSPYYEIAEIEQMQADDIIGGGGVTTDSYVTGTSFDSETKTLSLTRNNGLTTLQQVIDINTDQADGLISGGIVTWISGLTFAISSAVYQINKIRYTYPGGTVTLSAADATDPRIDVIYLSVLQAAGVITGTPASSPQKPSINSSEQVELTFVLLPALATEPSGITDELVYDENVEWTTSVFGITVNFDSTTQVYHGSKSASAGLVGKNDWIAFTNASPLNVADYETLSLSILLKATMTTKQGLYVQFMLGGVAITQELPFTLAIKDITNWQNVAFLFSDFIFTSTTFDEIRIRWNMVGTLSEHTGFYLDYVKIQKGLTQPTFTDTVELIGDVLGSGRTGTPIPTQLAQIITAGTFGDSTHTVTITIDAKGRVTAITENEIEAGLDGREIELSTSGGYVVWRYVGDVSWINLFLIPLDGADGINGIDGTDGREVEMSIDSGYVVWRYVGEITWNNLFLIPSNGIDGVDGADGITPHIGINGNWFIDTTDTGVPATGADGLNGIDGQDGNGISSIVLTSTVGLVKTYTITFTNASTFEYTVTDGSNGLDGSDGIDGLDGRGIVSVTLTNTAGLVKTYTILFTDSTTFDFDVTDGVNGIDGINGTNGTDGADGNGIASVTLISTVGLVKTYRITFTDATTFDFSVTDGADGADGVQPLEVTGLTLLSTGWTLVSGFYEYDLSNANITATSEVEVIFMKDTIAIVKAADIMPDNLSDTGTVKIYATNEPTDDINVTLIITEVTV